MASRDDIRPDCTNLNTTECILLATQFILAQVKENGDEFNWDPPTFAVTLIIGLIALFFAALTIGQGLIAATPGKQCSSYALGPWAHFSTRGIEWSEMRAQATAYTPIIRIQPVLMHLFQLETAGSERRKCEGADVALTDLPTTEEETIQSRNTYPPSKHGDQYFPATWLALLTSVGLDHPGIWALKPTRTDYLPSDLVAAPAYASVRDMVTLAALAAFPTRSRIQLVYQSDTVLGSVHHEEFDLDFRQHPSIGMHGVFQTFNTISRKWGVNNTIRQNTQMPSQEMLAIVLNANGQIPQKESFAYDRHAVIYGCDGSRIREDWVSQEWLYETSRLTRLGASSACARPDKGSSEKCGEAFNMCQCLCKHGDARFAGSIARAVAFYQSYQQRGSWVLLMADIPQNFPTLFPKRIMNLAERVQILLPLSRFWSLEADQSTVYDSSVAIGSFVPGDEQMKACRRYLRQIDEGRVFELQSGNGLGSELMRLDAFLETISPEVLSCRMLCLGSAAMVCSCLARWKWTLASGDRQLYPWSKADAEGDLTEECRIPLNFSSKVSRGRVTDLWVTLEAFLAWYSEDPLRIDEDGTRRGRSMPGMPSDYDISDLMQSAAAEELEKVLQIWEVDENEGFTYGKLEVQHPVDDLLIYRAIMVAMLYSYAVDNSDLLEEGIYHKTVPFL